MVTINAYLNFPGTTEAAFEFYKSIFGGEFAGIQRFKETPEGPKLPADEQDKLMHVALPIGNNILMATDALESQGRTLTVGNNFSLSLTVDSQEEAQKYFDALSAGGKVEVPLQMMFWGEYFAMLTDKFGIQWMVSFDPKRTQAK
jgi:PhnB protein